VGTIVHRYTMGRGQLRWSLRMTILVSVLVIWWNVLLRFGYIGYPGWLALFLVLNELQPLRGVALTSSGFVVTTCSFWFRRPQVTLAAVPPHAVRFEPKRKHTIVHIGPERVRIPNGRINQLVPLPPPPAAQPTPTWVL